MDYTTEVREGHSFSQSNLSNYLSSNIAGFRGPLKIVRQFKGGQSNPTFLLRDQDNKGYVLRKKPPGKLLPRAHDIKREYNVMKALQPTNVPVPHVYCLCEDDSVIGTAFYVMELVEGRIIRDLRIPGVSREERRQIYLAAVDVVAKIGSVNIKEVGLDTLSRNSGDYYRRQLDVWNQQYQLATQYVEKTSPSSPSSVDKVEKLVRWLREKLEDKASEKCGGGFLVHGDFRIDNLVIHPTKPIVLAVLDWELSALGHPYNDLASLCLPFRGGFLSENETALEESELEPLNIPTEAEMVEEYLLKRHHYTRLSGRPPKMIQDWNFYLAFSYYRFVSILQGVFARHLQGNASDPRASLSGVGAIRMAEMGLHIAHSSPPSSLVPQVGKDIPDSMVAEVVAKAYPDIFNVSDRAKKLYGDVYRFMMKHVFPMEEILYGKFRLSKERWIVHPEIENLKALAKKEGLWNLWIPKDLYPEAGAGLTNLEYAPMAALMGSCLFASEVFNCSAPDTGNMEVLLRFGTPAQKKQWLQPLLEGEIRSCFGMTEPEVASSDARNIQSEIRRVGDEYIINGKKWWTSGAGDPRCKICIFMGKTYSSTGDGEQSMILVPMDTPGVIKIRPLTVFGYDDAPHGHFEVHFRDVRVPVSNIIWGEGKGFAIAQARLGPGRIHHCMRTIGKADRCIGVMIDRGLKRETFGKKLVGHQTVQKEIADSRSELEQARLLTLFAASKIDALGAKAARSEIAMIKVVAPNMALKVIDRAIQVHGGAGVSQDFFLAYAYAQIRTLRLADGPDEVHRGTISKLEIRDYIKTQKQLSKL